MSKPAKRKINFVSLGCAKNLVDSEKLMGLLGTGHYNIVFENQANDPDIVIINTCGFINDAKEESVDNILQYAALKKQEKISQLIVMGCLSERYKNELKKEIPEIDAIFGVNDIEAIAKHLSVHYNKNSFYRQLTTPSHYAFLKISEGCNRKCAFCAIPAIRGQHISYPFEKIIEEARFLAQKGVKELIVVAQDTTYYGVDKYKKRRLSELLKALTEIQQIEWIRLNYTYPDAFPKDVLKTIATSPKICNYIDIPLQHISDNVLKTMKRGIDKKKTYELINNIRQVIPDVSIRTSFIVGFPNETEKDFEELYKFIEEMRFERVGVFKYSHEENTQAYNLKDKVSERVKNFRYNTLMDLQQSISLENNIKKIGHHMNVLIDYKNESHFIGRTFADAPEVDNEVHIETNKKLQVGNFYNLRITDADAYTIYAKQ